MGRVKSLNYNRTGKEQVLKSGTAGCGYQFVRLCKKGNVKCLYVHRLVAQAWLPSPQLDQTEVNHKDEDKTNNRVENLVWCNRKDNINYGTRNQRVAEALSKRVLQYDKKGNLIAEYLSAAEATRQTGINYGNISSCCSEKYKSAGGFVWKYKN